MGIPARWAEGFNAETRPWFALLREPRVGAVGALDIGPNSNQAL